MKLASRRFLAVPIALMVLIAQATCACARASLVSAAPIELSASSAVHACCATTGALPAAPHRQSERDQNHDHSQPCAHCGTTASAAANLDAGSIAALAPLGWVADVPSIGSTAVQQAQIPVDPPQRNDIPSVGMPLLALFCALNL